MPLTFKLHASCCLCCCCHRSNNKSSSSSRNENKNKNNGIICGSSSISSSSSIQCQRTPLADWLPAARCNRWNRFWPCFHYSADFVDDLRFSRFPGVSYLHFWRYIWLNPLGVVVRRWLNGFSTNFSHNQSTWHVGFVYASVCLLRDEGR